MVTFEDVLAARQRIRGIVAVTPCPLSEPFSELCGARIYFKLENLHRVGSFKERGAANKFALLTAEERKRGVVAASAGNHAQGVAYNAQRLKLKTSRLSQAVEDRINEEFMVVKAGEVELISYQTGINTVRRLPSCARCREPGARESYPISRSRPHPSRAKSGAACFVRTAAIAPKIFDERVVAFEVRTLCDGLESRQMLPSLFRVEKEIRGVGCLVALHSGSNHKAIGLTNFPLVKEFALPTGAFAAEALDNDIGVLMEKFDSLFQRYAGGIVTFALVPDRK